MNSGSECLDESVAFAFLEGRMGAEDRAAAERHLDGCDTCRRLLGMMASLQASKAPPTGSTDSGLPSAKERYTIVGEYGRGGQARILLAFDETVGREVVLKELLPSTPEHPIDDDSWRDATARFLREAELTGQLVHPGVVPVFEIGRRPDGSPFYTMQLVRGRTLSEVLRECHTLPARLGLLSHFLSVCQVVAYAHSRGILHRDIKPQNIMVGEFGETVLLDWGLAKQKDDPDTVPLVGLRANFEGIEAATLDGTVVGTPGYMSPEQASGRLLDVDERSDVFGLGAVLFEILTGETPPKRPSSTAPRVRDLVPEVPPELAGIAEKALAPDKQARYRQAVELAQDITAYTTGGRVAAYDYTGRDLLRRFAARHRLLLGAGAVVLTVILSALVLLVLASRSELTSRRAAMARGREALQEGVKSALLQGDVFQARAKLRGAIELEDSIIARALWRKLRLDPERFSVHSATVIDQVAFAPGGRELALGLSNGAVQLVDLVTRSPRILRGVDDQLSAVAFEPSGKLLAAGSYSGPVALWDLSTGALLAQLGGGGVGMFGLAFSSDGSLLFVSQKDRIVIWNVRARTPEATLAMPATGWSALAVSPDDARLAARDQSSQVHLWNLQTRTHSLKLHGNVSSVSFSADGSFVLGAGLDGDIYVWRAESGELHQVLRGHHERVARIARSPRSGILASASYDGTVRLWSLPEGRSIRVLSPGQGILMDVAFSADGNLLAAASFSTAWVWDLSVEEELEKPFAPAPLVYAARFDPGGARLASASADGVVRLWDVSSGELIASWAGHRSLARDLCFTPDGRLLASVEYDGTLIVRDLPTGAARRQWSSGDHSLALACAPDSRHFVIGGIRTPARLWDEISGEQVRVFSSNASFGGTTALTLSKDGRLLFAGRNNRRIEVWETATGKHVRVLSGHKGIIKGLAYDPKEGLLASGSMDGTVRLWSTTKGESRVLAELSGRAYRLAWDLQGERLIVPTSTGEIEVWGRDGVRYASIKGHASEVNSIDLSSDGKSAVSASDDGTVRLWDTATWQPKWYTRALVRGPAPLLLTHAGWRGIDASRRLAPATPAASAWRVASEAARLALSQPGGPLCVAGDAGLEVWDLERDAKVMTEAVSSPFDVAALPGACSILEDGRVTLYRPGKPPRELASGATSQLGGELLTVIGAEVMSFDPEGNLLGNFGPGAGVTAAAMLGERMAIGFRDGGIELRAGGERMQVFFQDTPGSAVRQLAAGPAGTLVAGFADGSYGVWDARTGTRLEKGAVHGPVRHLVMHEGLLLVASDLGATATLDLSLLTADYCELVREVWSRVPILWREDGAFEQAPDPAHRCSERRVFRW